MIYVIAVIIIIGLFELLLRFIVKKQEIAKLQVERKALLDNAMQQDFSAIAKSLNRVELSNPLARILCVDKDASTLDKIRNILVMEGYSVDTVNNGKEAIQLSVYNHYDFVFISENQSDYKPQELIKTIHDLRDDFDIIFIGDENTKERGLEKAVDFIQKRYIDEKLIEFIKSALLARREKIDKEVKEVGAVISADQFENETGFVIPMGVFIAQNHLWVYPEKNGEVKIGLDDFIMKLMGDIATYDLPNLNLHLKKGQALFTVKHDNQDYIFKSPLSGRIVAGNVKLRDKLTEMQDNPFFKNWICSILPDNFVDECTDLVFGHQAIQSISEETRQLEEALGSNLAGVFENISDSNRVSLLKDITNRE